MTFLKIWAQPCGCGRDVARLMEVPLGVRVICDKGAGGCGCFVLGETEAHAVAFWNRMQALQRELGEGNQTEGAQALTLAAARRAMGAGVQE